MTDHDQLFKRLLKLFFPDLLGITVPEIARGLDLGRVRFLEQESFSDVPIGERVLFDILAEVPILGHEAEIEPVLILTEVDGDFRQRAEEKYWRYYAHLRLNYHQPVLVVVLWLHGGQPGVSLHHVIDRVLGQEVNRMTYVGFGLSGTPAEDFLSRPEPIAWALAALMHFKTRDRTEHKLSCLRPIAHAQLDEIQRFVLLNIVETYIELNDEEAERFAARLASQTVDAEVKVMAQTWSEKMKAEGYERGIEQGRAQGLRQLVQHLLERRFGPLSGAVVERLAAIRDPNVLDELGQRLLDARSLEELGLVA